MRKAILSLLRAGGLAMFALLVGAEAQAQTAPAVIHACYLPATGTVYRIKAPNTPAACRAAHVEFSWPAEATPGAAGPQGPAGGVSGYEIIQKTFSMDASGLAHRQIVLCPAGKIALSGGVKQEHFGLVIAESYPYETGTGWVLRVSRDAGGTAISFDFFAICATPG